MAFSEMYVRLGTIFLIAGYIFADNTCLRLATDGYTVPRGDITRPYGEDLSITCNLYKKVIDEYGGNASSRLFFSRKGGPIPQEMIKIENSTSISLHIPKHPKTADEMYYCYFNSTTGRKFICMNVVMFGVTPQNITDFSCVSRNYENLTCTWTPPNNYVQTDYNLTYYLKARSSREYGTRGLCLPPPEDYDRFLYNSAIEKMENGKMRCFWNLLTTPQYRKVHECYYFTITMNNTFGTNVNHFVFDHFKYVVPGPPENLTAVATSPHSVLLSWGIPEAMALFKPGLHHRIIYQCEYDKVWQLGELITNSTKVRNLTYEVKGLKYAHALYDFRVSMISSKADPDDESMWSVNATRTVRTKSKIPDCPPKIHQGSFEITATTNNLGAFVYWQQIEEKQKNGQNFSYVVEVENYPWIRPTTLTKTYASFNNLSNVDYIVNIWSVNEKGRSSQKSTIMIPANRLEEPTNFVRVSLSDNMVELRWEPPKQSKSPVTNYTIFWCQDDNDRQYQCQINLNWTTVPANTRRFNQTLPRKGVYQFAISANSWNSSSGMVWARCTIIPNRTMGKILNVQIPRLGSDFIDVMWKLDCTNRLDSVKGFIIYYCQLKSPSQTSCEKSSEKNVTIKGDASLQSGTIEGLKPYTSYRVSVGYIVAHNTYSQPSESTINTTSEGAPSPPLNVEVFNITNSSISVRWQPPLQLNGMLRFYRVYYNNNIIQTETDKTEATLVDLESFENYSISVAACTVNCSNRSQTVNVMTKMGLPGVIEQPVLSTGIDSYYVIDWKSPRPPRGEVNYYEIKRDPDENGPYINLTSQNYTTDSCTSEKYKSLYLSVRAVNIINGEHKKGPWSEPLKFPCNKQHSMYILLGSGGLLVGILMLLWFIKKLYGWWTGLEHLEPKLPPGLQADIEIWDSGKSIDINQSPPADAERLLQKIGETRLSGDSSGCSSGHESITSSLESTAHISPSDSGTEQPRSPSLNEDNAKHSLRQRNKSAPRPTINTGYVMADAIPTINWTSTSPTASPGNYCVLGVDPSKTANNDPPYVPVSCDLSQPPPYVMTGDLVKSANIGYVPYPATDTPKKTMGYVVAGLTNDLLTTDLIQCDSPKAAVIEEKPLYMRVPESIPALKPQYHWSQPPTQPILPKTGYVSVGDAPPPPKTLTDVTKGYVPHRFEAKSLKED